jgi:hypothetical protein
LQLELFIERKKPASSALLIQILEASIFVVASSQIAASVSAP